MGKRKSSPSLATMMLPLLIMARSLVSIHSRAKKFFSLTFLNFMVRLQRIDFACDKMETTKNG
ncbi:MULTISPECIES: hypothetical protein [Geobacillus]|uniref:Uncharacterized protein n=1 Tax=Geobacillus subterraneus TaxID=129338 RepID=A0A679FSV4_9BACL|nr:MULTISPECIES: hypothetical protein [Geobacillus]KYD23609.1 hypothetical protein B4113_2974 [Geobacillus sp. B4113_201601]BBW96816.1 hypothetical protein GsuE55_16490 [Geobacillus subterraneus]